MPWGPRSREWRPILRLPHTPRRIGRAVIVFSTAHLAVGEALR
jgi:hypothetical protein